MSAPPPATAAPPAAVPAATAPAATPPAPAAPAKTAAAPPPPPPKPDPPFVLEHDSKIKTYWDALQFLVVCFIGIVVPLRIGFGITVWRPWVAPDVLVDVTILLDILLNLVTTFEQEGEMVRDRNLIWWNYFQGWFWFDVVSVLPGEIVAAGLQYYTPLYRSNRLVRFMRLGTYFRVWERDSSIQPTIIRLIKSAFAFLYMTSFIGCAFYLIVSIEGDVAQSDWVGMVGLLDVDSLASRYFRSWYWGMIVLAGFNNANPTTIRELVFTVFVTTGGVVFFSTLVGAVGDMASNIDSSKIYFRTRQEDIAEYMQHKKLPSELQNDIRSYYSYLWNSGKALEKNDLLRDLPRYLKNKMNLHLNREIVAKVPLFKQCADDTKFITALVMCLKSQVTLPNLYVVRKGEIGTDMYFISRGELNVVTDDGKVVFTFRDGGFFGEIALLYDTKRTATIVSRTYCDMFILTKDDFKKVLRQFPEQSKGIKEAAKDRFQKIIDEEKKKEVSVAAEKAKIADDQAKEVTAVREEEASVADQNSPAKADSVVAPFSSNTAVILQEASGASASHDSVENSMRKQTSNTSSSGEKQHAPPQQQHQQQISFADTKSDAAPPPSGPVADNALPRASSMSQRGESGVLLPNSVVDEDHTDANEESPR